MLQYLSAGLCVLGTLIFAAVLFVHIPALIPIGLAMFFVGWMTSI